LQIFLNDPDILRCLKGINENNVEKALKKISYYSVCWGYGSNLEQK